MFLNLLYFPMTMFYFRKKKKKKALSMFPYNSENIGNWKIKIFYGLVLLLMKEKHKFFFSTNTFLLLMQEDN